MDVVSGARYAGDIQAVVLQACGGIEWGRVSIALARGEGH